MSVSGTMRRRITPRAWACSAAPSRSRTSACAVRIGRGPRRSASARLSPSTQLAVRYANEPTTPAAYTWRIAGWSRAASVSVSRRNQARPGCVVAHIPQRYADTAVARIHRRRKEPRELRDGPALRGDEGRAHRGVVEVPSDGPPSSRDAVRRSGEPLPAEGSPHDGERRPAGVGAEPL